MEAEAISKDYTYLAYKKYVRLLETVHNHCWGGWTFGYQPKKSEHDAVRKLVVASMLQEIKTNHSDTFGNIEIQGFAITPKGISFFYEHYDLVSELAKEELD